MVTADGRLVRADHEHELDLFWAVRGGGGSFGVVTALEFRLFPPHTGAYAGALWYPIQRAPEVLHARRELTRGTGPGPAHHDRPTAQLPAHPADPEQVRGQSFAIVEAYHTGNPAQPDALLGPLRALGSVNDTITTVPMPALSHLAIPGPRPRGGREPRPRVSSKRWNCRRQ